MSNHPSPKDNYSFYVLRRLSTGLFLRMTHRVPAFNKVAEYYEVKRTHDLSAAMHFKTLAAAQEVFDKASLEGKWEIREVKVSLV